MQGVAAALLPSKAGVVSAHPWSSVAIAAPSNTGTIRDVKKMVGYINLGFKEDIRLSV